MNDELYNSYNQVQNGYNYALERILEKFKPCLIKNSLIDDKFNEDCFQELSLKFIICVKKFKFTFGNMTIQKYL
ncbi:helix-turn-helix domain-containing protein [Clostridium estertheticum]|uniref:helix-turn-helix domain-containing protein n=1 Tax=Clostridium estertheticum TaxID=238834 RepID=UPI001C0C08D0|nr:helix-turn-helix domain-containing protein [Clostridium estertheticum]MBU3201761.1 helix-turn-helix domain-containing protein [Clostridium estertheticum]WAG67111.1 helix-turn-helix domain-containing protein [Clostridium estertheticum]